MIEMGGAYSDFFWFLVALFFSKWIVYFVHRIIKSEHVTLAVCLGLFVIGTIISQYNIISNYLYLWQTLGATLFVDLGVFMKHEKKLYERFSNSFWVIAAYIFLCLLMFVFNFRVPSFDAGYHPSVFQAPEILLWSIVGVFALLSLCRKINANRLLEFFGRNTLVIYCFHAIPYTLVIYLLSMLFTPANLLQGTLFFISAFCLELLIMSLVVKFFDIYPFRLFIGKWNKKN